MPAAISANAYTRCKAMKSSPRVSIDSKREAKAAACGVLGLCGIESGPGGTILVLVDLLQSGDTVGHTLLSSRVWRTVVAERDRTGMGVSLSPAAAAVAERNRTGMR